MATWGSYFLVFQTHIENVSFYSRSYSEGANLVYGAPNASNHGETC